MGVRTRKALLTLVLMALSGSYIYAGKTTGVEARISPSGLPPDSLQYIANSEALLFPNSSPRKSNANNSTLQTAREPLHPAFLGLLIYALPGEATSTNFQCLKTNGSTCATERIELKKMYTLIIFLCGLSVWLVLFSITKNYFFAFSGFLLVSSSQAMWLSVEHLLSEPLAALILIWASFFVYIAAQRDTLIWYILAGIGLGFLYLIKIAFLPLAILYLIFFVWFRRKQSISQHLLRSASLVLAILIVLGAQMFSGLGQTKERASVAFRGGAVLVARANYNNMSTNEYLASFVYWAGGTGRTVAHKLFDYSVFANLDRKNPNGFFSRGLADRDVPTTLAAEDRSKSATQIALTEMLTSPIKHLIVSIPVFYRGLFAETGFDLGRGSLLKVELKSSLLVGPFLFGCFFVLIRTFFRDKATELAILFMPTLYSIAFHSLVTHNIPRYSIPLIPMLIISLLLLFAIRSNKVIPQLNKREQ